MRSFLLLQGPGSRSVALWSGPWIAAALLSLLTLTSGCVMLSQADKAESSRGLARDRGHGAWRGDSPREAGGAPPLIPDAEEAPLLSVVTPRKVIYTGTFEVVVAETDRALAGAKAMAEKLGGYMQRMTASGIVIRVPAAKFDAAVAALAEMGTVTEKDISAQDVTETYVDLELRLRSAKVLLGKLEELLGKAKDVKGALAVEKELTRVREEIERMEGRLNRMKNEVAYATLSIGFVEMAEASDEVKTILPFWWLRTLGVECLLDFEEQGGLF